MKEFFNQDVAGESSVAQASGTDVALGSEAEELATKGVFFDNPGAVALLLPVLGILSYEDITSGSNFVTTELFGSNENATSEENSLSQDIALSGGRWVYFPTLYGTVEHGCGSANNLSECVDSYENEHSFCSVTGEAWRFESPSFKCKTGEVLLNRFGKPTNEDNPGCYVGSGVTPCGTSTNSLLGSQFVGGVYLFEFLLPGHTPWYVDTVSALSELDSFKLWKTPKEYEVLAKAEFCNSPGAVAGFPSNHENDPSEPELYIVYHSVGEVIGPAFECSINKQRSKSPYSQFGVAEGQKEALHHRIGLPRQRSLSEINKLEEEKRLATKVHAKPSEGNLEEKVKKMAEVPESRLCNWSKAVDFWNRVSSTKCGETSHLPGTQEVPDCFFVEESGSACKSQLEADGFTKVSLVVVTWDKAIVTKPADAVITVNPAAGSFVNTDTAIVVDSNPKEDGMPIPIPFIKFGKETGEEYKKRLEEEGWTKVERRTLPDSATDPRIGPNQASYTVPQEGTETNPDKATDITVEQNPEDAPVPPEGGGGIGSPNLPGFHIPNFGVLCQGFPFGVPCWLINTIGLWSHTGTAPEWGFDNFTIKGKTVTGAKFDLSHFEPVMEKVRIAELLFSTLGVVMLFYRFARGGSPPSGSGDDARGEGE